MDNAEKFNEWMKSKVQSYYYSNNLEMLNAFNTMTDKNGRNYSKPRASKSTSKNNNVSI
jgi:hypothetical protein